MKKLLTFCLLAVTMCALAQQKKVAVYVKGNDIGLNKVLEANLYLLLHVVKIFSY